jgi:hypothetical protein
MLHVVYLWLIIAAEYNYIYMPFIPDFTVFYRIIIYGSDISAAENDK